MKSDSEEQKEEEEESSHEGKEVWTLRSDCDVRNSYRKVFVTLTLREHDVQDEFARQRSCDALERKEKVQVMKQNKWSN